MNYKEDQLCRVGDPIPEPRPLAWELVVSDHVPTVGTIRPANYFITSGDAVAKARVLQRDLLAAAAQPGPLAQAAAQAAQAATRLLDTLIEIRGTAVFLETEHNSHRLLCIPKNPRNRLG